jgi:hypothetical protein
MGELFNFLISLQMSFDTDTRLTTQTHPCIIYYIFSVDGEINEKW